MAQSKHTEKELASITCSCSDYTGYDCCQSIVEGQKNYEREREKKRVLMNITLR